LYAIFDIGVADALAPAEQRLVEKHLRHCDACRAELGEWMQLAGALRDLPIPMAPASLVIQTQRLLSHAAVLKGRQTSRFGLAFLVWFSWMFAFVTFRFVRLLDMPLAQWLDVSSTTVWVAYLGVTWFATALAAGLLGKHWRQEGRTV
jgi:anti-sigma factor RsiW